MDAFFTKRYEGVSQKPLDEINGTIYEIIDHLKQFWGEDDVTASPRFHQLLYNSLFVVLSNEGCIADILVLLREQNARNTMLKEVRDKNILLFWKTYDTMTSQERTREATTLLYKLHEIMS